MKKKKKRKKKKQKQNTIKNLPRQTLEENTIPVFAKEN